MNELNVTAKWRRLFNGQNVTEETLKQAQDILKDLSEESPLRFRLAKELEEIRKLKRP